MPHVLVVDDEPNIRRMVRALLEGEGFEVTEAEGGERALELAARLDPDIVLLDLMMPGGPDGITVLERLRQRAADLPVIMMSGRAALADAVRATQLGAAQFLEKPLTPETLLLALQSGVELRQARLEARALRHELGLDAEMIGRSPAMDRVRRILLQVAPTESRILITGESGSGKELAAAAIHNSSTRRNRPFVRVNCAAIPRDLVESEMFGHERGAFTGATERRVGRFELATKGTLFLDEVGDLNLEAQAKLLRAIEAGEIERLGGGKPIPVDVRVIAATNKDLLKGVDSGEFREDLYFRLNVIPVHLPPLRDRPEDVPLLVLHFATRHQRGGGKPAVVWSEEALSEMSNYSWPGNVRELANVVERLSILHMGEELTAAHVINVLRPAMGRLASSAAAVTGTGSLTDLLDSYERSLISGALEGAGGNVAEAARRLQTERANLYRRMRRLGLAADEQQKSRLPEDT